MDTPEIKILKEEILQSYKKNNSDDNIKFIWHNSNPAKSHNKPYINIMYNDVDGKKKEFEVGNEDNVFEDHPSLLPLLKTAYKSIEQYSIFSGKSDFNKLRRLCSNYDFSERLSGGKSRRRRRNNKRKTNKRRKSIRRSKQYFM